MGRDYYINAETLVAVKFGAHVPPSITNIVGGSPNSNLSELGLASEGIRVSPRFTHTDVRCADFGPNVPAELLAELAEVRITMRLVHFDHVILNHCFGQSMGGVPAGAVTGAFDFGRFRRGAGVPMGTWLPVDPVASVYGSGYHYVSLNLTSPALSLPWRFPASLLTDVPVDWPLGTKRSEVELTFRVIPFVQPPVGAFPTVSGSVVTRGEIASSGAYLWLRTLDT